MTFNGTLTDEQRAEIWQIDEASAKLAADVARISRDRYLMKCAKQTLTPDEIAWYRLNAPHQLSLVNQIERNNARIEVLFNQWAS